MISTTLIVFTKQSLWLANYRDKKGIYIKKYKRKDLMWSRQMITTQKVLFYTFNSLCFKHFCVVALHIYSNWHVKDLEMNSNHIFG